MKKKLRPETKAWLWDSFHSVKNTVIQAYIGSFGVIENDPGTVPQFDALFTQTNLEVGAAAGVVAVLFALARWPKPAPADG